MVCVTAGGDTIEIQKQRERRDLLENGAEDKERGETVKCVSHISSCVCVHGEAAHTLQSVTGP